MTKKGFITKLYPLTKAMFVGCMLIIGLVSDWRVGYLVVLPLCLLLAIIDGVAKPFIIKVFGALVVFVVFIFAFKIFLDKSASPIVFQYAFITIRQQGILDALNQTSILTILASAIILFFETTDVEDFMISLQQINMSHMVSYVILSTLQMIPEMFKKSKIIMQAQQARGIETEGNLWLRTKAFFPSLGPLIISSIADLEERAITLEVRGFSADVKKTSYKEINKTPYDQTIFWSLIAATAAYIGWRIFTWLF